MTLTLALTLALTLTITLTLTLTHLHYEVWPKTRTEDDAVRAAQLLHTPNLTLTLAQLLHTRDAQP